MGTVSSKSGFWLFRRGWVVDAILVAIPWAWLMFLLIWGKFFGPNAAVPWRIGDRATHDFCIGPLTMWACGVLAAYMIITLVLCRRNVIVRLIGVASYLGVGLIAPALAFA